MKFITAITAMLFFFFGVSAQTAQTSTTTKKTTATTKTTTKAPLKNYCKMQDGMMLVTKDGFTTTMSADIMLANGTVIKSDGSVLTKAGKRFTLKNGQTIDMKGHVTSSAKKP